MTRIAFITGGSSGIGQSIMRNLQASGWEVIAPTHGELDLSDLKAVGNYANKLRADKKHFDAFIGVAGIWHDQQRALSGMRLEAFNPEQIIASINVALTSTMVLLSQMLPTMQSGTVIGISGTFENGGAGWLPYYVSKRGLEDLVVGLSQDYPELKVYGISPSDTATLVYQKFFPEYVAESQSPQAVAKLVGDLLDGNTSYKNGDIIELRQGLSKIGFHV